MAEGASRVLIPVPETNPSRQWRGFIVLNSPRLACDDIDIQGFATLWLYSSIACSSASKRLWVRLVWANPRSYRPNTPIPYYLASKSRPNVQALAGT